MEMWKKPWGYKEGIAVGAGLVCIGILLQGTTGYIQWNNIATPINKVIGVAYLLLLCGMHLLRKRVYLFRWLSGLSSSITALGWVAVLTLFMAMTRQEPPGTKPTDAWGLSQFISAWYFVLPYWWLTTALGLALLNGLFPFKWRRIPFVLNHLGLLIVMICATLGSADMLRLRMMTRTGQAEWRATDEKGLLYELPLAIELKHFTIDEYPPKLMLIDNETGHTLPEKQPVHLLIEKKGNVGKLMDWEIEIIEDIPQAGAFFTEDSVRYTRFDSMGATHALYVKARNLRTKAIAEGWVSCGSFAFPHKAQKLNEQVSLVMPAKEPRRFASFVEYYTESGLRDTATIEVNKPLEIEGWKVYQLSYDEEKGKWSDVSTFELVKDPWLPLVYTGIGFMLTGALGMFIFSQQHRKENTDGME